MEEKQSAMRSLRVSHPDQGETESSLDAQAARPLKKYILEIQCCRGYSLYSSEPQLLAPGASGLALGMDDAAGARSAR